MALVASSVIAAGGSLRGIVTDTSGAPLAKVAITLSGADFAFVPEVTGFGFVLFEATGEDKVGKGDVRLLYNTDTIHLEIERIPLGKSFELSVALRGEVFFAGLLRYYYEGGLRRSDLRRYAHETGYLERRQRRWSWKCGSGCCRPVAAPWPAVGRSRPPKLARRRPGR